jgi:hypothetical protein
MTLAFFLSTKWISFFFFLFDHCGFCAQKMLVGFFVVALTNEN